MDVSAYSYHVPVLLHEVLTLLDVENAPQNATYMDATLGGAGHARNILRAIVPKGGRLIGIDRDTDALKQAEQVLSPFAGSVSLHHANYKDFESVLSEEGVDKLDYILVDLGVSMHQLKENERGFTYRSGAPLDSRMNREDALTAEEVVNTYSEQSLCKILSEYGEERFARQIAQNIVRRRQTERIDTSDKLNQIVEKSVPAKFRVPGYLSRTYQAIRIEVNQELTDLQNTFRKMIDHLAPNGRIAIITFHSIEDRIAKVALQTAAEGCICDKRIPYCVCGRKPQVRLVNKHPMTATKEELSYNTASSCAKLRVAQKIAYPADSLAGTNQ